MDFHVLIQVSIVFQLVCPANIIGLWWAVGSPLVMDVNGICRKSRKFAGAKQQEICQREPKMVDEIANGGKMAIVECQFQFASRRWNCTTTNNSISKVLQKDTRNAAFLQALSAAGVLYAVTQACSLGLLVQCSCDSVYDDKRDGNFEWGGCNDDVGFGYTISKDFMDIVERIRKRRTKRNDVNTQLQAHNNEAGRLAIRYHMKTDCKCHGLSGSCALKTCWKRMPHFREVGNMLKEKFDGATQVSITNDGKGLVPVAGESVKGPEAEDLLYTEESGDYCRPSRKIGSLGTKGRICDPKSQSMGGCELLCCERGYNTERMTVVENCNCKFRQCCEVICEACERVHVIHRCK